MNLFDIDHAIREIISAVDENGELAPDLAARLDELTADRTRKYDSILSIAREQVKLAEARSDEANRLKTLAATATATAERLRNYVLLSMQLRGETKIETDHFVAWTQLNPPRVETLLLPEQLPKMFVHTPEPEPRIDKKALIEHWKSGKPLPAGVEVIQTQSLRVK